MWLCLGLSIWSSLVTITLLYLYLTILETRTLGAYGPLVLEYGDCFFVVVFFVSCLFCLSFFCSHLGFYWCKKCDRGKKEGRGPGSVFYVDWFLFIVILSCVATECSVQCPVSRCPGSPSSETHRPFFFSFFWVVQPCEDDCVKTTFEED